jgi:predicted permease
MDNFVTVINNSFPLFFTIIFVLFLRKRKILPEDTNKVIRPIIFKMVLPFFVFNILYKIKFDISDLEIIALVILVNIIMLILVYAIGKSQKVPQATLGSILLATIAYGVGPSAYSLVKLNFSEEIFSRVVIIDIALFVMIMILAPIIASLFDSKNKVEGKKVIKAVLSDVVLITVFITTLINLFSIEITEFVLKTSISIGSPFVFLVTIFLAMTLKMPNTERLKILVVNTIARIILVTAAAFIIIAIADPSDTVRKALFLTLLTPFSSFPLIYTDKHNLDTELISQLSIFSIIVFYILYPILIVVLL